MPPQRCFLSSAARARTPWALCLFCLIDALLVEGRLQFHDALADTVVRGQGFQVTGSLRGQGFRFAHVGSDGGGRFFQPGEAGGQRRRLLLDPGDSIPGFGVSLVGGTGGLARRDFGSRGLIGNVAGRLGPLSGAPDFGLGVAELSARLGQAIALFQGGRRLPARRNGEPVPAPQGPVPAD